MARILIIDDDADFCRMLEQFLCRHGHECSVTNNGTQGLQAISNLPDIILCDVDMPGVDGHGVIKLLRQDAKLGEIPFIFVSACANHTLIRQGFNLGGDDFIGKPVVLNEVLAAIDARLARRARQNQRIDSRIKQEIDYYVNIINDLDKSGAAGSWKEDGVSVKERPAPAKTAATPSSAIEIPAGRQPVAAANGTGTLLFRDKKRTEYLTLSRVKVFMARGEYSKLVWDDGRSHMLRKPIIDWIQELPKNHFFKIHRATIINLNYFDRLEVDDAGKRHVYIKGMEKGFPVSQRSRAGFNAFLKMHKPAHAVADD